MRSTIDVVGQSMARADWKSAKVFPDVSYSHINKVWYIITEFVICHLMTLIQSEH